MLAEMLMFGTIWFWGLDLLLFGILIALTENDHDGWAFLAVAVFVGTLQWIGSINIFADPWSLAMWIGVYAVVGVAYSFIKWISLLYQKKDQLLVVKKGWCKLWNDSNSSPQFGVDDAIPPGTDEWENFKGYVSRSHYHPNPKTYWADGPKTAEDLFPDWAEYKGKLVKWIIWWPMSAFWTLLSDPIARFANWVVLRFRNVYKAIATRIFKNVTV